MVARPTISPTTSGLTFLGRSRVAQVCLRSWKRAEWGSPAFLKRGLEGVSGGVIGTISEPVASDTSFCLLCEGGVAAFIYVRLIARRVGVRIVTGSERRR